MEQSVIVAIEADSTEKSSDDSIEHETANLQRKSVIHWTEGDGRGESAEGVVKATREGEGKGEKGREIEGRADYQFTDGVVRKPLELDASNNGCDVNGSGKSEEVEKKGSDDGKAREEGKKGDNEKPAEEDEIEVLATGKSDYYEKLAEKPKKDDDDVMITGCRKVDKKKDEMQKERSARKDDDSDIQLLDETNADEGTLIELAAGDKGKNEKRTAAEQKSRKERELEKELRELMDDEVTKEITSGTRRSTRAAKEVAKRKLVDSDYDRQLQMILEKSKKDVPSRPSSSSLKRAHVEHSNEEGGKQAEVKKARSNASNNKKKSADKSIWSDDEDESEDEVEPQEKTNTIQRRKAGKGSDGVFNDDEMALFDNVDRMCEKAGVEMNEQEKLSDEEEDEEEDAEMEDNEEREEEEEPSDGEDIENSDGNSESSSSGEDSEESEVYEEDDDDDEFEEEIARRLPIQRMSGKSPLKAAPAAKQTRETRTMDRNEKRRMARAAERMKKISTPANKPTPSVRFGNTVKSTERPQESSIPKVTISPPTPSKNQSLEKDGRSSAPIKKKRAERSIWSDDEDESEDGEEHQEKANSDANTIVERPESNATSTTISNSGDDCSQPPQLSPNQPQQNLPQYRIMTHPKYTATAMLRDQAKAAEIEKGKLEVCDYIEIPPPDKTKSTKVCWEILPFVPRQPNLRPSVELPVHGCPTAVNLMEGKGVPRLFFHKTKVSEFVNSGCLKGHIIFTPDSMWPDPTLRIAIFYQNDTRNSSKWLHSPFITMWANKGREMMIPFEAKIDTKIYLSRTDDGELYLPYDSLLRTSEAISFVAVVGAGGGLVRRSKEERMFFRKKKPVCEETWGAPSTYGQSITRYNTVPPSKEIPKETEYVY